MEGCSLQQGLGQGALVGVRNTGTQGKDQLVGKQRSKVDWLQTKKIPGASHVRLVFGEPMELLHRASVR